MTPTFSPAPQPSKDNRQRTLSPQSADMLRGEDPLEAWPRIEEQLAPVFDCQPVDLDKVLEAIDVLAHCDGWLPRCGRRKLPHAP